MSGDVAGSTVAAGTPAPDEGRPRRDGVGLAGSLVLALVYAGAVALGRAAVIEGETVSLVWPAAGVAGLWLLSCPRRQAPWVLAWIGAAVALVLGIDGAHLHFLLLGSVAAVLQTWLLVVLLRRWCPELLGAGGSDSVHSLRVLGRGTAAILVASGLGAVVGTLGLRLAGDAVDLADLLLWWGRQVVGLLAVGSVGHLGWEWWRDRRRPSARPTGRAPVEALVLALLSALVVTVAFTTALALTFLTIPFTVWCAARFSTFAAAVHAVGVGAVAVALTVVGEGPFARIADPDVAALVVQLYLVTGVLTALAVGTLRDQVGRLVRELVTAREEVAGQAELLSAMTESLAEGLLLVDVDGELVRVNASAQALLDRTPYAGATNAAQVELLRPDGSAMRADERPSRRAVDEGETSAQDVTLPLSDGSSAVLSVRAVPLTGGRALDHRTATLVVWRDVTEERAVARRLAEFAETVAHDLRSPLTAIGGFVSVALAEASDGHPAPAARLLRQAQTSAHHMAGLIDDLLARATVEGADLVLEPLVLAGEEGLVAEAADLLDLSCEVSVDPGLPEVLADRRMVTQLFSNLLDNAAKYVPDGVRPQVVVSGHRRGTRTVVDVTDNGIGVPEEDRALVFERFHRTDAARAGFEGTGMGLSICRTVVERHGGRIECLPAASGQGSTFRFDLPGSDEVPA